MIFAAVNAVSPRITGGNLLQNGLNVVWFAMGFVAVITIVVAGYRYLTSNGDPQKASQAQRTILVAVIGLVVASLAFAITNFVVGQF